jgi:hypothetical protein
MVAPLPAPTREEDRVLIRPVVISKYKFDLLSLFIDSIHDPHFSLFVVIQFLFRHQLRRKRSL